MKIPEGWPTDVMIEVGANVISAAGRCDTWDKASDAAKRVYKAMNEHAPTPPAQGIRPCSAPYRSHECKDCGLVIELTPPAQEADYHGEDLTKFYILRKPGFVPRVCRPMGDDLAANLRDWFKHHAGATIDIVRVRLIDGRVSDLWVDDGIEYLQILDDGGWIPERPYNASPPAQGAEPVAYVPVHPRTGPLWSNTTADPNPERLPSYPLMSLYTRPANDELRQAAARADKLLTSLSAHVDFDKNDYDVLDTLRVALEGKS